MNLEFEGTITEVRTPRTGTGQKGEWANVEFEVTELNPNNPEYPQIGLFDLFKNGEYVNQAKEFATKYPLGTSVKVEFNLKKNTYTKEGKEMSFYKTSAWKVEKLQSTQAPPAPVFEPAGALNEEDHDDLPFC